MSIAPSPVAMSARERASPRLFRWLVWIFGVWCGVITVLVTLAQAFTPDPIVRAMLRMALGVVVLWIIGAGSLSLALHRPVRRWLEGGVKHWRLVFVLWVTGMALLEEAVTTSMTNLAPRLGVTIAQAHVTASGNYLDVVLLHSVIVFVPMFIAWSWLLWRYDFHPLTVLVLYGITGTLLESSGNAAHLLEAGFWVFVYGLMVYLPAHVASPRQGARSPGIVAWLLAVLLPIVSAIPVVIVVQVVHAAFFASLP